jgi:hypothetical protein
VAVPATAANPAARCADELQRLAPETQVDLATRCPGLSAWLSETGFAGAVQPPVSELERAGQVRAALELLADDTVRSEGGGIDRARLERIVERASDDQPEADTEPSLWSKLKAWLAPLLPDVDIDTRWLVDLVRALGWLGQVVLWLGYGALALALGLCLWLAGKWLYSHISRPLPDRSGAARPARTELTESVSLDAVAALPSRDQPPALLRLIIARLRRSRVLEQAVGKTDTELAAQLERLDDDPAARFRRIAAWAELTLYADRSPDTSALERCFADARALIQRASDAP